MGNPIPSSLQAKLWSSNIKDLDLNRDQYFIIHHTLRYGNLDEIRWLQHTYNPTTIKDQFLHHPKPIYSKTSLNFTKKILLNLSEFTNDQDYLQSLY